MKELTPQNSSVLLMFISIIIWYNIIQNPGYKIFGCIDIHLWMKPVEASKIVRRHKGEPSQEIARRVIMARKIQDMRFEGYGIHTNSEMPVTLVEKFCSIDSGCQMFLEKIIDRMGLSARACSRILKLARTIADLEAVHESIRTGIPPRETAISQPHLAEAAGYRLLDRQELF